MNPEMASAASGFVLFFYITTPAYGQRVTKK